MILDEIDAQSLRLRQSIVKGSFQTVVDGPWREFIRIGKAEIADSKHITRKGNRLLITVANGDAEYRVISECSTTREVTARLVRSSREPT